MNLFSFSLSPSRLGFPQMCLLFKCIQQLSFPGFSSVFVVPERAQYPFLWLSVVGFGLGSFGGRGLGISFVTHQDVLKG